MRPMLAELPPYPPGRRSILAMTIAVEGGMLALAVALGLFLGVPFWTDGLGHAGHFALGLALSVPLSFAVAFVFESRWRLFDRVRGDLDRVIGWLRNCSVFDLLLISISAGVCEEALFRGFLQTWLTGLFGTGWAIAATAVLFGLAHAISVPYALFAGLISVGLGLLYAETGGLLAPIALHGAYDFAALVYGIHLRPKWRREAYESPRRLG